MKSRFYLQDTALNVNSILDAYIVIENETFRMSWRRIIPIPLFFEAIDFGKLENSAQKTEERLIEECKVLENLQNRFVDDAEAEQFRDVFCTYCDALLSAVRKLRTVLNRLNMRSKNSNSYLRVEYKNDMKEYGKLRDSYTVLGGKVNDLYRIVFKNS